MSGDYTRFTYDARRDYTRPRPQQGRVLLDADLNELSDAFDHRLRALALDVLGPCTAPVDQAAGPGATADGFKIVPGGTSFTIGLGRLYLHGLQLDNHGGSPFVIEPGLRDERGQAAVAYEAQPYYPNPPAAPTSGEHLVYVDAWEREVTAVSDPSLVDPAVAVDTSARMQTVWQVKVLPDEVPGATCATDDAALPGWSALTAASAARLTVKAVGVPAPTDPCSVPADGGYRGWDNRLYRVEVQKGGTLGTATFTWSRDNASVETAIVDADATRKVLTVTRTGRDDVQRIREGAWVEVLDDEHELKGMPGQISQVQFVDAVDDMAQTVTLVDAVTADFGTLGAARRTRLRQWDHSTATGTIDVSAATGGYVLEDGVQITFTEAVAGGPFRTGDYWTFAARSADASIQKLDAAPPQGPRHFYGRLGIIGGKTTQDCRAIWPCECEDGCAGECTECVTPESHASGQLTIQMAVDHVRRRGGTVCLAAGRYVLDEPVVIAKARGLTLRGHRWASILEYDGPGPAVAVVESIGVQLLDITVLIGAGVDAEANPADVADGPQMGTHPTVMMREKARADRQTWSEANADYAARGTRTRDAKPSATPIAGIGLLQAVGVRIEGCVVLDVRLFGAVGALAGGTLAAKAMLRETGFAAKLKSGFGQTAGIVTAGVVAGLAVRDCVLVASVGICAFHTLAASLRYAKTHVAMVSAMATGYSLLVGVELTDDIVIAIRSAVWWDEAVITSMVHVERCMLDGLLGIGFSTDAHPLGTPTELHACVVAGRMAGIASSAPGLMVSGCRVSASGSGATGADANRQLIGGDAIELSPPAVEGILRGVVIRDNAIHAARYGVASSRASADVLVADNHVVAGQGGIVQLPEATGERWVVRGNDVTVTGVGVPREGRSILAGVWLVQARLGEVRENYVHDIGSKTQFPLVRFGIAIERSDSVLVVGNTVVNAIGGGHPSSAAGIGCWPDSVALDIVDNIVAVDGSGAANAAADVVAFSPIRIDAGTSKTFRDPKTGLFFAAGPTVDTVPAADAPVTRRAARREAKQTVTGGTASYLLNAPAHYLRMSEGLIRLTPDRVFVVEPAQSMVSVRGNRIETHGIRPALIVDVDGALSINGNQIRHAGTDDGQVFAAAVMATADSMVVNANHVEAPGIAIVGRVTGRAMVLVVPEDRCAVAGNAVVGRIEVDGAPLAMPWLAMNVILG